MPSIITVMNSKGGVGKTTTTVNLAACLARHHRVAVADGDPQRSVLNWFANHRSPFALQAASLTQISELPENPRANKFDYIIVDTHAGISNKDKYKVADASDLVIIPSKCSLLDIEPAVELAQDLERYNIPYRVLLTQVPSNVKKTVLTIKRILYQRNTAFFQTIIRQREAHVRATHLYKTVYDMGAEGKRARADYDALSEEVKGLVFRPHAVLLDSDLQKRSSTYN